MTFVWLNGALLPAETARIDPSDRGFLLGDGLFETMAAREGAVAELARHHARLSAGAALLRMPAPPGIAELAKAIHDLLAANGLREAALRLTLTRGPGPRGLLPAAQPAPTLLLTAASLPAACAPLLLHTSRIRRDEDSPLSAIKSLNYLPNVLARLEAAEHGADDALLLNRAGRVAESSAANLFVLLHGAWVTPPVSEGALPGVCRACLLETGRVREAVVTLADLAAAQAVCAGNALALRQVAAIDGRKLPLLATP